MAYAPKTLRVMADPAAADIDWAGLQVPPGPRVVVSGVDADGVHSFNIAGETVSYARSGSDDSAAVASGLAEDAAAQLAEGGVLERVLHSVIDDGAGTLYLVPRHDAAVEADLFTVDTPVVQGGASITITTQGNYPITARMPDDHRYNGMMFWIQQRDSSDVVIGDNSTTISATVVVCDHETRAVGPGTTLVLDPIATPFTSLVPAGALATVQLSAVGSGHADLDNLRVLWAPARVND